jgi:hypothetical protein
MNQDDKIAHYQAKAAEDDDEGRFAPPLNLLTEIGASDSDRECQKAYRDSWRNHHDQTNE